MKIQINTLNANDIKPLLSTPLNIIDSEDNIISIITPDNKKFKIEKDNNITIINNFGLLQKLIRSEYSEYFLNITDTSALKNKINR